MSILTKSYGKRQDAIVTDCYVVMPEGVMEANTYTIDLCFDNGYKIANLQVLGGDADSELDYDVLIGMDVITKGDFCVSTVNEQTVFSFRMPAEGIRLC